MTKSRKTRWLLVAVLGAAALAGCGRQAGPSGPRAKGLRVVSTAPNVTEILFMLGAEGSLVGVTDSCDYPPAARNIEQVGGFGRPNVEKILSLAPNLVIATGLEQADLPGVLSRSNIRVLEVHVGNFAELEDAVRQIGRAVDKTAQAEQLAARMQTDLETVAARHAATPPARRPKVFVEIEEHPLLTAGGGSFLDDLVARAGGVNVAHDIAQAYPRINPEKVIDWNPDVILVLTMGSADEVARKMAQRVGWGNIAAVKNGRIIADIDPDLLSRPGPRLVEGVKILAARLERWAK